MLSGPPRPARRRDPVDSMYGPPKPTKNQWIEREKNEKGSSYSPPMQRGQQQITRAPDVRRAESLPLDGRIANARHLSDAGRAQAYGEVSERSVEDIIVPSNNVQNKAKGDLPDAKDVRLQGFQALAKHGIISKKHVDDYEKTDARVRAIEANTSLSNAQKGTQLDAIRSDYLKRNDPRGFQDRMPVYNSATGEMDKFLRQDHKTNDMLNLSMEARKQNALIFGEVTSSGDPDVKNAKLGTSIPGASGFKPSKGTSSVRSPKELLRDIADHDLEMTEESWAGAAELAKEEGYTPDPLSVKKETPVTKRTIKGLLSSRQVITPKSKGLAGDDALVSTWEKDAVRISDIVNSHSTAMSDSKEADKRFSENMTTFGSIEVAEGKKGVDVSGQDDLESKLDKEVYGSDGGDHFAKGTSAYSDDSASFVKKDTLHGARRRVVGQDDGMHYKRNAVLATAGADAAMHLPEFRKLHPAGTDRDFVRFMAQKSLKAPQTAENPFTVERIAKDSGKYFKIETEGDYGVVHKDIADAIGNGDTLGRLASRYSQTEILQLEDNDLRNAATLTNKAGEAAESARVTASLLDPKDPRRAVAVNDHEEMIRYADHRAKGFEIMKLKHEQNTGKPWEGSGKQFDSTESSEFVNEATKAEAEMAHYKSVYDDPSVGWKARKEAESKMKEARIKFENFSNYASAKSDIVGNRVAAKNTVAPTDAIAIANEIVAQASQQAKPTTVSKGLGGRFKR